MTSTKTQSSHHIFRSPFWAIILVGVGMIWLMGNLGILSPQGIGGALRLWPVLLIATGIDLLCGRQSFTTGVLIGSATVIFFIGLSFSDLW